MVQSGGWTAAAALGASVVAHGGAALALAMGLFEPAAGLAPFGVPVEVDFDTTGDGAAPEIPSISEAVLPEPQSGPVATAEATASARESPPSGRRPSRHAARERPARPDEPVHAGSGLPQNEDAAIADVPDEPVASDPGPQRADGTGVAPTVLPASAPGPMGSTPSATELLAAVAGLDLSRCLGATAGRRLGVQVRVHVTYRGASGRPRFAGIMHVPFAGTPEGACICRELTARAQVRPFPAERADVVYQLDL